MKFSPTAYSDWLAEASFNRRWWRREVRRRERERTAPGPMKVYKLTKGQLKEYSNTNPGPAT